MANSVEVRFPFLDDELVEFCMSLDDRLKIRGLNEKYILKKIAAKYLPGELINRQKFPYRSSTDFRNIITDPYLNYMLSDEVIKRYDVFSPVKVRRFIDGIAANGVGSERETMLLMGVLTTQVLCDTFDVCRA
jgi:asparagine synthase (glutamine-hydrolysing)